MVTKVRLERLRKANQPDLDALPDRVTEPIINDSDASGGVALTPTNTPGEQPAVDNKLQELQLDTSSPNTERRYIWLQSAQSSYNPALSAKLAVAPELPSPAVPLPCTDLSRGDLGSATQHYSPIVALSKFPYKWSDKIHSQDIASAFFDQGKFWAREWDLYYVWDIEDQSRPLVLIREAQVQALLDQINEHLKLGLRISEQQCEDALVSRFPDHPRCRPRYLGRSNSRADYDNMVANVPDPDYRAAGDPVSRPLDDRSLEAFKQLMEESFEAQRAKSKAVKAKRQQERLLKQKSLTDQFKRAQRYLGLRPGTNALRSTGQPPGIDPELSAPYVFDQSVVFVSVDVESYERAHHKITEVGIATLDTKELADIAPGEDGKGWRNYIRARHFRIKENAHLVNSEFVSGHPDGFDFGESMFVSLAEAPAHIAACFAPPFGAHRINGAKTVVDMTASMAASEQRKIIFLGHDTLGDVRYLQNLGYDPMVIDNLLEALDTAVMYRVWRREHNPTSLGRILHDFDIAGYKLHNAGNDAVFTMQAMLAICVREASMRNTTDLIKMRSSQQTTRLAGAVQEAEQRVRDEADGWSDHEREGDGGPPIPLSINPAQSTPAHALSSVTGNSTANGAPRGSGRQHTRSPV